MKRHPTIQSARDTVKPLPALTALLAFGSLAQAHPGHDLFGHGAAHVATSPFHLLGLAIVATALAVAAKCVRSAPARSLLRVGAIAGVVLAAALVVLDH
jgi:hypothetical protein